MLSGRRRKQFTAYAASDVSHGGQRMCARRRRDWNGLEHLEDRVLLSLAATFASAVSLPTGALPDAVIAADLNGDGKVDVVTANQADNAISVLYGNGDGTFGAAQTFAVGAGPDAIVAADLNGDGKLDLVTANGGDNTISVLLASAGGFAAAQSYAVGSDPDSVVAADLNGDGKLDLATANAGDNTISVLFGNGDGTFGAAAPLPVGPHPTSVVAADINGDGNPDLATANFGDDTISVVLGNGDGTFEPQSQIGIGRMPYAIIAADLNGDGNMDLVTANRNDNTVSVLLGAGNDSFLSPQSYGVGGCPYSVVAADLNGDGVLDLAVANASSNAVSVLLGIRGVGFGGQPTIGTGFGPVSLAAANFLTGESRVDLVTANIGDNTASLLVNTTGNPAVGGVSPNIAPAAGGTRVTITGANLAGATAVHLGSQAASIVSDTASCIVVTSPPEALGTVDVTVTTAVGTSAIGSADHFTYGYVDLTGQFASTLRLPASDISGDGKVMTIPVVAKNVGNMALPAGQRINIAIDANDGGTPTVLKTLTGLSVSSLGAGMSVTFVTTVSLPIGLAAGTYNIVAVVDSSNLVTGDTDRANNTATTSGTIAVTYGYTDLAGVFGTTWTLLSSMVAGKALTGSASVVVSNLGNVALPTGQLVNIQVVAHDTTNTANPDITLATLSNQSVSALAAGGTKQFSASVNKTAGLPADIYQILANVTPVQALTESRMDNNTASAPAHQIVSTNAFVDLAGVLGTNWTLPSTAAPELPLTGSASVVVSNLGNVPLPTGQQVNIQWIARDTTNAANPDIVLATLSNQSVSALAAGGTKTFSATVNRAAGLPADGYRVLANIVPVQALAESRTDNDTALVTALGGVKLVTASPLGVGATVVVTSDVTSAGNRSVTLKVSGIPAASYGNLCVLLFAQTDQYYRQPLTGSILSISAGGLVTISKVNPGSLSAWVVTKAYAATVPATLTSPLTVDGVNVLAGTNALWFAGSLWNVKTSTGGVGPGPNVFGPDSYVDSHGALHLQVVKTAGQWQCSEVWLPNVATYGRYTFYLNALSAPLDPSLVLGAFLYADGGQEIDMEIGTYANPDSQSQWVVQPNTPHRFVAPLADLTYSYNWEPGEVDFQCWTGHSPSPASPSDIVDTYTYSGSDVPAESDDLHVHLNLWLFGGNAPTNGQNAQVVVAGFLPPAGASVTTPAAAQRGNVPIQYKLTDAQSNLCAIQVEYSANGGASWSPATMAAGGDGASNLTSSAGGTAHTYMWNSTADIGANLDNTVQIRITPTDVDGQEPAAATGSFTVNDLANTPPSVALTTPTGMTMGSVAIQYTLTDAESDPCGVLVQYSTNGGASWSAATTGTDGDGTSGLASTPGGASHTFVWNSVKDLGAATAYPNVLVRVTPSDALDAGAAQSTGGFMVNGTDLSGAFGTTWTLPSSAVSGTAIAGSASVVVSNLGNVPLPTGQNVNIQLVARDTTNAANPDIVLATLSNQSVSALAEGGSKTFSVSVNKGGGVPADSYEILANIIPVQALAESRTDNNTAAAPAHQIVWVNPFLDLSGVLGTAWTLPTSMGAGKSLSGSVSVVVSNLGNMALPTGQTVNINFIAHDTTHSANPDITLLTLNNQSVTALAAGATKTFTGTVSRATGLPADHYQIEATITPVQPLTESNLNNNTVLLNALGNPLGITVI